jgi:hypothetical protein
MKSRAAGLLRKENARGKTDHAREPETRADGMKLQKKMAINWNCSLGNEFLHISAGPRTVNQNTSDL